MVLFVKSLGTTYVQSEGAAMRNLLFVLLAIGVLPLSPLRGDGLLYSLPADGTWCTYAVKSSFLSTMKGEKEPMTIEGVLTLASVGKERVKGEQCRWIELVIEVNPPKGEKLKSIFKGLIPEKYLAKGENPSGRWLKGWVKLGDGKPQALTPELLASPLMKLNLFVSGPLQEAKPLAKKAIETGLGKLSCEGVSGVLVLKGGSTSVKDGKVTVRDATIRLQNYFHEKAPFGVAWSRIRMGPPEQEKGIALEEFLTLKEVGTGAKSQLPD
jgi:hypothetical protein